MWGLSERRCGGGMGVLEMFEKVRRGVGGSNGRCGGSVLECVGR